MFPENLRIPGSLLAAACGSLVAIVATIVTPTVEPFPTAELPAIFNGRDLSGWRTAAESRWLVDDGVLVGTGDAWQEGSTLHSERSYGDFVVEAEVRFSGEIDSGIVFRKPELQVQIGVSRSLGRDMTCSIYDGTYPEAGRAGRVTELFRPGQWNRIRVEARGDTFTVWLNGEQVSSVVDPRHAEPAPVGLELRAKPGGRVEFRDVRAVAL